MAELHHTKFNSKSTFINKYLTPAQCFIQRVKRHRHQSSQRFNSSALRVLIIIVTYRKVIIKSLGKKRRAS